MVTHTQEKFMQMHSQMVYITIIAKDEWQTGDKVMFLHCGA